jgi:hypothetical protein
VIFRLQVLPTDPDGPPNNDIPVKDASIQIDGEPQFRIDARGGGFAPNVASGTHTFALAEDGGNVFTAGPYEIDDNKVNRLFFFGPRNARRFLFTADDPETVPVGKVHVRIVNLAPGEKTISVFRCHLTDNMLDRCTRQSPPVGNGETWAAVLPIDNPRINPGASGYLASAVDGPTGPVGMGTFSPTSGPGTRDAAFYCWTVLTINPDYTIPWALD